MESQTVGPETMPAFCSRCGFKLSGPARFCNSCGASVASGTGNQSNSTTHFGGIASFAGADSNHALAQLQQLASQRQARREMTIAAVLAFIGVFMLVNKDDFALHANTPEEFTFFKIVSIGMIVAGVVVGLRGAARYARR